MSGKKLQKKIENDKLQSTRDGATTICMVIGDTALCILISQRMKNAKALIISVILVIDLSKITDLTNIYIECNVFYSL